MQMQTKMKTNLQKGSRDACDLGHETVPFHLCFSSVCAECLTHTLHIPSLIFYHLARMAQKEGDDVATVAYFEHLFCLLKNGESGISDGGGGGGVVWSDIMVVCSDDVVDSDVPKIDRGRFWILFLKAGELKMTKNTLKIYLFLTVKSKKK